MTSNSNNRRFNVHRPVLAAQVLHMLDPKPGDIVWDLTMGAAGHSALFLEKIQPQGFLLGVDRDPQIAEMGIANLEHEGWKRGEHFDVTVTRFSQIREWATDTPTAAKDPDIILADLGVSSLQLDEAERGFSFRNNGPLNMQMTRGESTSQNAAEIVNNASAAELERIFREYGEERWAKRITLKIVEARDSGKIETTSKLREIIAAAVPRKAWPPNVDVSTRVFQALRIAVNEELDELDRLLEMLPSLLNKKGARAGIISFHSLEDRRVKQAFRKMSAGCTCPREIPQCVCNRKPSFKMLAPGGLTADESESADNPRARSARLRGIERIDHSDDARRSVKK